MAAHKPDRSAPLATGDVVFLKSGSPPLTVYRPADDSDLVQVEWFAGEEVRRDCFPIASLTQDKSECPAN